MSHTIKKQWAARLSQIALGFIPALIGWLALLNNIEGRALTMQNIITPLLSMQNIQHASWRAIHSPLLQELAYYAIASIESLVGLLATIGLIKMLQHFSSEHEQFISAQMWVRAACVLGILIWGIGFFIIGGDFFLSWQNNNLNFLQSSGLNYALIMTITYLLLKQYEHYRTL